MKHKKLPDEKMLKATDYFTWFMWACAIALIVAAFFLKVEIHE